MERKRCDNLACVCEVTLDETTCDEFCASPDGRDLTVIRCGCNHAQCAQEMARELSGEMAR